MNKPVKSNIMLNVTNNKMVITENIINDSTTMIYFMIQITKISRLAINLNPVYCPSGVGNVFLMLLTTHEVSGILLSSPAIH